MIHHQSCFTNSKFLTRLSTTMLLTVCFLTAGTVKGDLINGNFEEPDRGSLPGFVQTDQANIPGWSTTAPDGQIEIWFNGFNGGGGGPGVFAASGKNHAEINSSQVATLYQEVADIDADQKVDFSFEHRGRFGTDTMRLTITDIGFDNIFGNADDTSLFSNEFSAGNTAWVLNTSAGLPDIITLGNSMRFSYESVSTTGNNQGAGNFIDDAKFGLNVLGVPEPSSAAAILAFAGLGLFMRRRRR